MNFELKHNPVMIDDIIKNISYKKRGIYVDATFGSGGHARSILKKISKDSTLLVIDKDKTAIKIANRIHSYDNRIKFFKGSFLSMKQIALKLNIIKKIDNIVVDLGTSSLQLNNNSGFSFYRNSLLDMRMNTKLGLPAYKWLLKVKEYQLSSIIKNYGEEKYHYSIAKAIKEKIVTDGIYTTFQLINVIYNSVPQGKQNIHFATRIFQAIRISVNNELYELKKLLAFIPSLLNKSGILSIISFHSLEDRIVKKSFEKKSSIIKQIKKYTPNKEEIYLNSRSRSAILRVFKKFE